MQDFVGQQIDRYHISERLGMGGMAVVYKAYDTRLERDVAIKLIRTESIPQDQHERLLKRFEREAKSQARFDHKHIVHVYDYGEVDGAPFLVMAYIPGGTLKLRTGQPIPYQQALRWLIPIADALSYAQKRGVIHRDIKPSNILFDDEDQPILTDFGIAKILETDEATLTGTGLGVGTPEYMAPEQWQGQATPATDQYALGVMLYELLTGQKPYTADTPVAVALLQMSEPLRSPRSLVPGIPEPVENLLYKALARVPQDRYEDMTAFRVALEQQLPWRAAEAGKPRETVNKPASPPVKPSLPGIGSQAETVDALEPTPADLPWPKATRQAGKIHVSGKQKPTGLPTWARWSMAAALLVIGVVVGISLLGRGHGGTPAAATGSTEAAIAIVETPTRTVTFTPEPQFTSTTLPSPTITKTPRPTDTPTSELSLGMDSPMAHQVIKLENVDQVQELQRIGKGNIYDISFSPDGQHIAVGFSTGVYIYESQSLIEIIYIETQQPVTCLSFSPNGEILATGGGGYIRLWDPSTGVLLRTLESSVSVLAFSPDGEMLATGSWGETSILLWDPNTGSLLLTIEGDTSSVSSLAFSPDGGMLASGGQGGRIYLWNPKDGTLLQSIWVYHGGVTALAFSSDGEMLASGGGGYIRLWDSSTGVLRRTLEESVFALAFSPTGRMLASGGSGYIRLWDPVSGALLRTTEDDDIRSRSILAFSPDGSLLALVGWDGTIYLWDTITGIILQNLEEDFVYVSNLEISADDALLASVSFGDIQLRELNSGNLLHTLEGKINSLYELVFSPDANLLATLDQDGVIHLWDPHSGVHLRTLEGGGDSRSLGFSTDGVLLASGSWNGTIRFWVPQSGTLLNSVEGESNIAFSPDGRLLASWGWEGFIRLRDPQTGEHLRTLLTGFTRYLTGVVFSPDGNLLTSVSAEGTISLWDPHSGSLLRTLDAGTGAITNLAFSLGGDLLASVMDDESTIHLWDTNSGNLLRSLDVETGSVTFLAFSLHGDVLVSGNSEGTICLWDPDSGTILRTLDGHSRKLTSLMFSNKGNYLVSGSEDGTIRLWGIP